MTTYDHLEVARDPDLDGLLTVTLDRPDKQNALTDESVGAFIRALEALHTDLGDTVVRAVLVTGAGDNFCGGFDIIARNAPRDTKPITASINSERRAAAAGETLRGSFTRVAPVSGRRRRNRVRRARGSVPASGTFPAAGSPVRPPRGGGS